VSSEPQFFYQTRKTAKVSLDGLCPLRFAEVRSVERRSNAVPLLVWTHSLN